MTAPAEVGVWLVSECPIENGTLLKTERVVSLHTTADEALSEVRRQGKIMRDNDLRGFLYGYKFYPVPGLLTQRPAPESDLAEENRRLREALEWYAEPSIYQQEHFEGTGMEYPALVDGGHSARAALSAAEAPAGRDG